MQAFGALVEGQKGFFVPRFPPPSPIASSSPQTASYYDTTLLKATLERLCDFDRINSGETRVSVGAVNVATGNFAYFDNTRIKLRAEHFIASGALPPGFAAVELDGQYTGLGRRPYVEHTALEVVQAAPRHARVSGRFVERARTVAEQHRRCDGAREGCAVLQPPASGHGSDATCAALSQRASARARFAARRCLQERRMVQTRRRTRMLEALQHRAPDLPAQGIRRVLQGLSVRFFDHARTLGERVGGYSPDARAFATG